jgi:hypothetical protein
MLASIEPKLKVNTSTHTSSFAGGYPTFPSLSSASASSIPTETGITCGHCQASMPLLSQIYCPMEQGENDRTLYVWACPKADCQRRPGRCVLSTTLLALYTSLLYKPSSVCKHELIHHVPFMHNSLFRLPHFTAYSVSEHSELQRATRFMRRTQRRSEPRQRQRRSDLQRKRRGNERRQRSIRLQ